MVSLTKCYTMLRLSKILCLCLLTVSFYGISSAKKLPSFITPCKRNSPDFDECFTKTTESLRGRLKNGISQLRVPAVDPLHIPRLDLNTGNGTALQITCVFKDVVIFGGSEFDQSFTKTDLSKGEIVFKVHFPVLRIQTNYNITGRILVLPISGHGNSDGNFTEIYAHHVFRGHYIEKNNKKYLKLDSKTTDIKIGKSTMHFGNLFEGNEDLTESVNKVINDNSAELVDEFKPLVEDTVSAIIFQVWSNVFDYFSIEELFPSI